MIRVGVLLALGAASLPGQEAFPLSDSRWQLAGDSTRVETVGGREAVRFYTGSATRRDIVLQDGTIDVDVMTTQRRSFVYMRFRMEDEENHEEFYLRPHKSGLPERASQAKSCGCCPDRR